MRINNQRKKYFYEKVCIVTGGASGIGFEMVKYVAERGGIVYIADIDIQKAQMQAEALQKKELSVYAVRLDVSSEYDVRDVIEKVFADHRRLDILVNNAGIGLDGEFKDMPLETWNNMIGINLFGVVYGAHFAYRKMLGQGFGQIVNVSSIAGLVPGGLMTSYAASKHAVTGFTLSLRAEGALYGIKINTLCPGFVETPIHDRTEKLSSYLNHPSNQRNRNVFPTAEKCISPLMKGIVKNKALIIAPRLQKIMVYAYRVSPVSITWFWKRVITRLKKKGAAA